MPDPWKHVLSTKDLYKCLLSERPDSLPSVTPSYLEAGNKPEIEHSQEGSACAEGLRRRHGCSENGRSSQTPNPTGTGAQHNSDDAQARHDRRVKRVEKQMETVLQEAKADRYHVFICWGKQNECDILAVAIEKVKLESQSELWKEIRRAYYASRGSWRKFVPLLRVKNVSKASISILGARGYLETSEGVRNARFLGICSKDEPAAQRRKELETAKNSIKKTTDCYYDAVTGKTEHLDIECPEYWGENEGFCPTESLHHLNEALSTLSMRPFLSLMFHNPTTSEANAQLSREKLIYSPW
ncbi:uncharacterized protein HMPREF1541_04374 [Cyphellophora europaea CBS 101466]|uniref:Uncharacterized protein n=1 Tax=Cyphellophora europaea (strain CBS 101466) TaxID=1220924 RepID=W2RWM2_CYPE1|nr:uncharacterized protein HMPREF1541_04374 [Cyphellophora europaea CBS 101466]ETN40099.1 hypothetical protein HMPREF1541_04374 [Cyphellophora europaea CBS 101466]